MQFELGIFLFELLVLVASIKWIIPLIVLEKKKDISVAGFLNITALIIGVLVVFGCLIAPLIAPTIFFTPAFVALTALLGSFLFYFFRKKEKISLLATVLCCSTGVFLLPVTVPFEGSLAFEILTKTAAVSFWVLFIYMMQKLDRIPFFSFAAFSSLFIIISLMSSHFFLFFDASFSLLCFSALGLSAVASLILKKQNVMWFGQTLVFFLAYLTGYFGFYTSLQGSPAVLPIFIAFELLEIILAFSLNYIHHKKFLPLTTLFLVERAYKTEKHVAKAIKKVFWTCFFFAALGFVFLYADKRSGILGQTDGLIALFFVSAILLLNSYIVFSSWGQEKKEFKNLFKDIKKELNSLSDDVKKTTQSTNTNKKKKK